MAQGKVSVTETDWKRFVRASKRRCARGARLTLDLLAALSHVTNLSIGCSCENEARCHSLCRRTTNPCSEPRGAVGATVEAAVADGLDSVPHGSRLPAYIPFV